jgi:ankyrin repeat protein
MMVMTIWLVVGLSSLSGACAAVNKYRDPLARNTYPQFTSDTCKAIADAIWQGDTLRVAQLLSSKPKLATLVCGEWRVTPLHLAVLCKEAVIVRLLVNAGANVHQPDRSRKSALYYATWIENNCEILQYLIESGGDPNRKEIPVGPRYTPFLFAVSMRHSNVPCMLSAGAKIQVEGHPELNAIALALWKYDFALAKFLIQHPLADVDAPVLDASDKDTVTIDWYLAPAREHFTPWLKDDDEFYVAKAKVSLKAIDEIELLIADKRKQRSNR